MNTKKLFQRIAIFSIVLIFDLVFASEIHAPIGRGIITSYSDFYKLVETAPGVNQRQAYELGSVFEKYYDNFNTNLLKVVKDLDSCVSLYLERLFADTVKRIYFTDPTLIKSDYCNFLLYAQSRQCRGLLSDFEFFLDKDFLEKIYVLEETTQKDQGEKRQLQGFVENILVLFFLLPQVKTCDNVICKHKECIQRDDLNIYKAYGALRMYISLYREYIMYLRSEDKEKTGLISKRMQGVMNQLVWFMQNVLTDGEKKAEFRLHIRNSLESLRSTHIFTDKEMKNLRTKLSGEIFTPKLIKEPIPSEETVAPKKTRYEQYFQKLKGFFGRPETSQSSE